MFSFHLAKSYQQVTTGVECFNMDYMVLAFSLLIFVLHFKYTGYSHTVAFINFFCVCFFFTFYTGFTQVLPDETCKKSP
jgi:hypothetical protein